MRTNAEELASEVNDPDTRSLWNPCEEPLPPCSTLTTMKEDRKGMETMGTGDRFPNTLTLSHQCRNQGCKEKSCHLCSHALERVCSSNFATHYHVGDNLTAACGACIVVRWGSDGVLEQGSQVWFRICLLNAYLILQNKKQNQECHSFKDMNRALIKTDATGQPILSFSGQTSEDGILRVATEGRKPLDISAIKVHGNGNCTKGNRKARFVLCVMLEVERGGTQVEASTTFGCSHAAMSEPFAISSSRSRYARKKSILHVQDDVSHIYGLGKASQKKLASMFTHLHDPILAKTPVQHVHKVRDLMALCHWLDAHPAREAKFLRAIKLGKIGWARARAHVMSAVCDDFRVRVWLNGALNTGLVFGCAKSAVPDLERPLAILNLSDDTQEYIITPIDWSSMGTEIASSTESMLQVLECRAAAACFWFQCHHPGWRVLAIEANAFKRVINCQFPCKVASSALHSMAHHGIAQESLPTKQNMGFQFGPLWDGITPVTDL